jgi:hypothetical protein
MASVRVTKRAKTHRSCEQLIDCPQAQTDADDAFSLGRDAFMPDGLADKIAKRDVKQEQALAARTAAGNQKKTTKADTTKGAADRRQVDNIHDVSSRSKNRASKAEDSDELDEFGDSDDSPGARKSEEKSRKAARRSKVEEVLGNSDAKSADNLDMMAKQALAAEVEREKKAPGHGHAFQVPLATDQLHTLEYTCAYAYMYRKYGCRCNTCCGYKYACCVENLRHV